MTAQMRRGAGRLVALTGALVLVAALAAGCQEELTSQASAARLRCDGDADLDLVIGVALETHLADGSVALDADEEAGRRRRQ